MQPVTLLRWHDVTESLAPTGQSQSAGYNLPIGQAGRTHERACYTRARRSRGPGRRGGSMTAATADGLALVRRIAAADHFLAVLVTVDAAGAPQVSLVNAGVLAAERRTAVLVEPGRITTNPPSS